MKDSTKLLLLVVLIGLGVLLLAGPFGDWLQRRSKPPQTEISIVTPAMKKPLPTLRVRRDFVKAAGQSEDDTASKPVPTPAGNVATTLSNDEIEAALEQRQSSFQRCWTQRLKDVPGLSGRILLQFDISDRGKVQNILIAEATIHDDLMLRCVQSVLERISFREFNGTPITLTFPISFE